MKTFAEGCAELEELVGHGDLVGRVVVDQVLTGLCQIHPRGPFRALTSITPAAGRPCTSRRRSWNASRCT